MDEPPLPFELDDGFAAGNALGLIVLKTDETLEVELREVFLASSIACYHARIPSHDLVTPETLAQMAADLPRAAALLPEGVDFGAIGYGCTSGATVIGSDNVARSVQASHPTAAVTDPIRAAVAALTAVGARRIGLLTPYVPEVTVAMQKLLEQNGFQVVAIRSFGQSADRIVARINLDSTLKAIEDIGKKDCDAVFVSCTNLRSFGLIEPAETLIGKPVISSNLALAWHMLTLAGRLKPGAAPGRLFA
ncbi:MAG: aspartate/glutamate racemase family protein [Rhodobacteraceae bacterium]|nr:aspartate/glutamate racemase family protein [Paracoccaceae bacterium]